MTYKIVIAVLALITLQLSASTDHEEKLKKSWGNAVQSTREYGHAKKERLVEESKRVIAEAKSELSTLKEKASKEVGDTKKTLNQEIDRLENDVKEAEARLQDLRKSTAGEWNKTRSKIGSALDSIVVGFSKAWEEIRK